MNLVQHILTKNPCYTAGKKITVKGLMLHSIGCPQPKASVFLNSWNSESYNKACVHGFIDGNDGTVYQTLPWNHRGWHAGGTANNTHIGVEMCEPDCIKYTGGSTFTCSDLSTAQSVVKRTYQSAVELFAMLCKEYNLDPLADGVIISHKEGNARKVASNHGDPEHLWTQLKTGYTMDGFRKDVKSEMEKTTSSEVTELRAIDLKDMSNEDIIEKVGPLCTADQRKSGILACVSLAQLILESGYVKLELALNSNNCFGMKCMLSGNTWPNSSWDGVSKYEKLTKEFVDGKYIDVVAEFRKYPNIEKSISDHSAYLLGAKKGSKLRFEGLKGCTDYRKAITIIKEGGYATSPTYIENICNVIEKWNLTRFDVTDEKKESTDKLYRVRKTWDDAKLQIGAFKILENAKQRADENPGYYVFDESGNKIYPIVSESPKVVAPARSKDSSLAGMYVVTAKSGLNLRYIPGQLTTDNVVMAIPVNAVVHNYGYYTDVNGVKWLYVKYREVTGFVSSSYLRKL